jgi:hypothetical protein
VRRTAFVPVLLLSSACGGAPPASSPAKPVATVVVPQQEPGDEEGEAAPSAEPSRAASPDDFSACVASLRGAADLPSAGGDRETYERALAAERALDLMTARKTYYELVAQTPRSAFVPLAYLAFGEIFAAEAEKDPSKWPLAEQAYKEVAKYPPPANPAYAYAVLRVGDTERASDPTQALASYMRALDATASSSALPCSSQIASEARHRLVDAYVSVGAPNKAFAFFKAKSSVDVARDMLRELVEAYRRAGKWKEACVAASADPESDALAREVCKKP